MDRPKNIIKPKITGTQQIDEQILFLVENDVTVSIVLAQKTVDYVIQIDQQKNHKRHKNVRTEIIKNNAQEILL